MKTINFKNYNLAKSFADGCNKLHLIILGDNCTYWVVTFRDAQRLVELGYELI